MVKPESKIDFEHAVFNMQNKDSNPVQDLR